jgi:DNA-binding transcriptional LysR family regulator
MSDINDPMRVFVTVVESGGFSAAAEVLQVTPSAVSKILGRLEDRLGVRLLNRTTRRIDLTPEGETYLNGSKFILSEIDEMEAAVGQTSTRVKGLLRVNSGTAFGIYQLMPQLPQFMADYPELCVSIELTDRRIDVVGERTDLAIRTGPLGDGSLMARKIAEMRRVICASPGYLAQHGEPKRPEDLAQHNCLLLSDRPSLSRWPFRGPEGTSTIQVEGRVTAGSADGLLRLALAGAGILRSGDLVVAEALKEGALVPLLVDSHVVEAVPISAVYPSGRHRSPKVRAFVDFLVKSFKHEPWRAGLPSVAA